MAESDAQLTAQVLAGSEAAARELVRRYERPVFGLVVRMVRDPALAEDLAQEAFLKAFTRLASFDPAFKFSNWILKIANNTAIDYLRRAQPAVASLDDEEAGGAARDRLTSTDPGPETQTERGELAAAFEAAIQRLRPEYRQAVILRYQEDLGHEEIAGILGMPVGTVKSYLHRARAELAQAMADAGWGPCNRPDTGCVGKRGG